MKWPSFKVFLLPILYWIIFSTTYKLFLEPAYYDFKQHQIECRMARNYHQNIAAFRELRNYVLEIKKKGLIVSSPTYSSTNCSIPPANFELLHYEHTIGPDGPVFFGFDGPTADSLKIKLDAIDCTGIDYVYGDLLRVTYRGSELNGFRYFFPLDDEFADNDWLKLEDNAYYGLDMFELFCSPWYWAIDI